MLSYIRVVLLVIFGISYAEASMKSFKVLNPGFEIQYEIPDSDLGGYRIEEYYLAGSLIDQGIWFYCGSGFHGESLCQQLQLKISQHLLQNGGYLAGDCIIEPYVVTSTGYKGENHFLMVNISNEERPIKFVLNSNKGCRGISEMQN